MKKDPLMIATYAALSLIALVLVFAFLGNSSSQKKAGDSTQVRIYILDDSMPRWVHQFENAGQTLEQALESKHELKVTLGRLDCIDQVCSEGAYAWSVYADGVPLSESISSYKLSGGKISLRYGET